MVEMVPVADPGDPRVAAYVRLRDTNLRRSLEAEHGLFIAEGEKVIRRAVAAGYPVRSLLMAPRWAEPLADVLHGLDAPVYVAEPPVIEAVAGFPVHRGALAEMGRTPLPSVRAVLAGARTLVVCEDIVDHTNVGAIFRCVAALGVDGVLIAPRCADPLYRRAIKVSMGAVFTVPYARMTDWYDGLAGLRAAGFTLLALTPAPDAHPLAGTLAGIGDARCALLLGGEGDGLSPRWTHEADHRVRIPMSRGVDSLNVSSATAIACYELTRSRAAGRRP